MKRVTSQYAADPGLVNIGLFNILTFYSSQMIITKKLDHGSLKQVFQSAKGNKTYQIKAWTRACLYCDYSNINTYTCDNMCWAFPKSCSEEVDSFSV